MKWILIIPGVMFGLIFLGFVGSVFGLINLPFLQFGSQVNMNAGIIQKTYNADNALYNYHWFQERSASIVALDQTITQSIAAMKSFEIDAGPRKDWTFEDKQEDTRLRQVVLGQQAQYNSLVNEYNAHAKEVDRNIFQNNLPLFFNLHNI